MLKLILASCLFVACQSYTLLYPYTPVVVRLPPYVAQQPIISPVVIELPGEDEDGSGSGEEEPEYLKYECSKDGTFTVPGVNCSKYYVCNGGRYWIYNCNPGLVFDAANGYCNWPEQVTCSA